MLIIVQSIMPKTQKVIHPTMILMVKFRLTWILSKSLMEKTIHHPLTDKKSFQRVFVHSLTIPFKTIYKTSPNLVVLVQWLGLKKILPEKTLEKDQKSVITSLEICYGNELFPCHDIFLNIKHDFDKFYLTKILLLEFYINFY